MTEPPGIASNGEHADARGGRSPRHQRMQAAEELNMRKMIFWGTVFSGAIAAYLMYKRGESLGTIAKKATSSPVGSLIAELRTV